MALVLPSSATGCRALQKNGQHAIADRPIRGVEHRPGFFVLHRHRGSSLVGRRRQPADPCPVRPRPDCVSMKAFHPSLRLGDAFLHNSPYHGCSHPADHTLLVPVIDEHGIHHFTRPRQSASGRLRQLAADHPITSMRRGALIFPAVQMQRDYANIERRRRHGRVRRNLFRRRARWCPASCRERGNPSQTNFFSVFPAAPRRPMPTPGRPYPVRLPPWPSPAATLRSLPSPRTGLRRLPEPPFRRSGPTTPADRAGACRLLPHSCSLPQMAGGSASSLSLSRPAQALRMLQPIGSLSRLRRPLSRGSSPSGHPAEPLDSYQIIRQLSGWILPPQTGVQASRRRSKSIL
jgi:hydantoinase/oxoprolinase-like protein